MPGFNAIALYALADASEITLEVDKEAGRIEGSSSRSVFFGRLPVAVPLNVVSSICNTHGAAILCESFGDVVVLFHSMGPKMTCCLLDKTLLPKTADLFETWVQKSGEGILDYVAPAVKARYEKRDKVWGRVAA